MTATTSHYRQIIATVFVMLFASVVSFAQSFVRDNGQVHFRKTVPAGNYSGIAHIRDDIYALADDKAPYDGFRLIHMTIDTVSGKILNVESIGQVASPVGNRDAEGIVYLRDRHTLVVVGEQDSQLIEYEEDGTPTGRKCQLPKGKGNAGYESLAYDSSNQLFWTCTEGPMQIDAHLGGKGKGYRIRLQALDKEMSPVGEWIYLTESPEALRENAESYAFGVSELSVVGDSTLLILEREFFVPYKKIGAWVQNKLYKIALPYRAGRILVGQQGTVAPNEEQDEVTVDKQLLYSWRTRLSLFDRSIANYEGMCLGPKLADGSQTLILVADSQNQSHGILRDCFRTLVIK